MTKPKGKFEKELSEIKNEEIKEVKKTEEPKIEIEKFEVVKIINEKAVMVRSLKTGLLYSRPNKQYYITQIIK